MDPETEVSVVIPAYNAEQFIARTLTTVAAQTVLPYEVIVVDDGSSDGTGSIVDAFVPDNRQVSIRLLRESHRGPGAARNTGVLAANGPWIAFLDSDDLWEPTKLERMAVAVRNNPEANILCHNEIHRRADGSSLVIDYSKNYDPTRSLGEQLFVRNRFHTSAVLCRRELIIASGGFDTVLPNAQDYELWLRLSPNLRPLFIPEVLGVYVDRMGNITSGCTWRRFLNNARVLHRHRNKVSMIVYAKTLARSALSYSYHGVLNWWRGKSKRIYCVSSRKGQAEEIG